MKVSTKAGIRRWFFVCIREIPQARTHRELSKNVINSGTEKKNLIK